MDQMSPNPAQHHESLGGGPVLDQHLLHILRSKCKDVLDRHFLACLPRMHSTEVSVLPHLQGLVQHT